MNEFNPADWWASERAMQFSLGWFANPIFGDGDYPTVMREQIDSKSSAAALEMSRLPEFTADQIMENKGKHKHYIWLYHPMLI